MINKLINALIFIFLIASITYGCSCDLPTNQSPKKQVKEALAKSKAVFLGKVISINRINYSSEVTIEVIKSWKHIKTKKVVIYTGVGSGDCGYLFEIGKSYLVYAYGDLNGLETNICQRTTELEDARNDLKILGKGKNFN